MSGFEVLLEVRAANAKAAADEAKHDEDLAAKDMFRPGIQPGREGTREELPADVWRLLTR